MVKNLVRTSILILFLSLTACNNPAKATSAAELATLPLTQPPIAHIVIPLNIPAERTNNAGDHDSSRSADNEEAPGGDRFTLGQYERPFNAQTMDVYYPHLDIQDTQTFEDDLWLYATILVKDRAEDGSLSGRYAMEIDSDLDGRGDWLILASNPSSTEWTTDRVQVWNDLNEDIGGLTPVLADDAFSTNGYELKVFDSAEGNDSDMAWVRIAPDHPTMIQLAVKRALVEDDGRYLVGLWAGNDLLIPDLFDLNDHFTHEQAGAAMRGYEVYYPIKQLTELDSSCRVAVGFEPTGNEPGLCETLIPRKPGEPPAGCQLNDRTCASQGPGYYFDAPSCSCKYLG